MTSKDQELKKKQAEVSIWLRGMFNNESIPEYEMNSQTIDILHQLVTTNQRVERDTDLYVKDLKQKIEEYKADAVRVDGIMERLSIGQNNLTSPTIAHSQALAQCGSILAVRDPSDSNYIMAMEELHSDHDKITERLQSENNDFSKLSSKQQDILEQHSLLRRAFESVEKKSAKELVQTSKKQKEIEVLRKCMQQWETKISKIKAEINKTGVDETNIADIHLQLVANKDKLDNLEKELKPLEEELQSYVNLPPDAVEAQIKIEQMKRELKHVQARMTEQCLQVNLN